MAKGKNNDRPLAQNKRASHDYFIEETYEAGIVLTGTEIKSIRAGKVNISDNSPRSEMAKRLSTTCMSVRSSRAIGTIRLTRPGPGSCCCTAKRSTSCWELRSEKGILVPLKIYVKRGFAKLLIGLGKGKKQYDKRETAKRKDAQRDIQRALREKQKVAY